MPLTPEEEKELERLLKKKEHGEQEANGLPHENPETAPHEEEEKKIEKDLPANARAIKLPGWRVPYHAQVKKTDSPTSSIEIRAIVLEEGHNKNSWQVAPEEFARVAEILGGGASPLPAARVRPPEGELTWLLDAAAASRLRAV